MRKIKSQLNQSGDNTQIQGHVMTSATLNTRKIIKTILLSIGNRHPQIGIYL